MQEKLYYHGTWDAMGILEKGFSLDYVGENRGNYGALGVGIYLASTSNYASEYRPCVIACEITCEIVPFEKACQTVGLEMSSDGWVLWDKSRERVHSERLSRAFTAAGIQVVQLEEEVCVFDPRHITILSSSRDASWDVIRDRLYGIPSEYD